MENPPTNAFAPVSAEHHNGDGPLRSLYADDEAIADILPVFLQNLPRYLGDLGSRLEVRDYVGAARVCHDLKGTAGGYGYPQISEATRKLEGMLRAGVKDPGEPTLEFAVIARLCRRARAGVKDPGPTSQPS